MTQRERMNQGLVYDPFDEEVAAFQRECMEILYDFNLTRPNELEKRQQLLKSMFGKIGDGCYIEPPLHSNFGARHVFMGNDVYANYNLTQNETSAAMIIILGDLNYFDKFDTIYNEEVKQGHMTEEIRESFKQGMEKMVESLPQDIKRELVYFDCGIWTMQFANIAHAKGYDTNIIGGFKRDKVSELFDLDENLMPVMLIAVGKKERDGRPSTRMSAKDLVRFE